MATRNVKQIALSLLVMTALMPGPRAWAGDATALSGSYRGSIKYMPYQGVTPYNDTAATMVIKPVAGKEPTAVVTHSDQQGRYRETCSITYNSDGTITLKGVSWNIISGDSFSPDTFTLHEQSNGSLTGTSVDSSGGTSTLSMHH